LAKRLWKAPFDTLPTKKQGTERLQSGYKRVPGLVVMIAKRPQPPRE
jgi:hypothetical protein